MNGRNLRGSGIAKGAYRPRISGLRCAAIGRFSAGFFRFRRCRLNTPSTGESDKLSETHSSAADVKKGTASHSAS
jgi:hypothetical protein